MSRLAFSRTMLSPAVRRRGVVIAAVGLLIVTALAVLTHGEGRRHLTAEFTSAVGVYKGSEVRLMGVPIGTVTGVEATDSTVRLDLEYDASYDLPAGVRAVIVSPSVIADRFVQLTPAYDGNGPTIASGAVIPVERTRVPVELDRVFSTTNDLLVALGPDGANDKGSFDRLLEVGSANLKGRGKAIRNMLRQASAAGRTLADASPELFATVRGLSRITGALAASDRQVAQFNDRMREVTRFLADDRAELSSLLQSLARSLGQVETFVRENRELLVSNVDHLARIAQTLQSERDALNALLRTVPVALNDLNRVWDADNQSIRSRANLDQIVKDLDGAICDALVRSGAPIPFDTCEQLIGAIGGVG